jgi:hypothetical protein
VTAGAGAPARYPRCAPSPHPVAAGECGAAPVLDRRSTSQRGAAVVELLAGFLVLVVPLVYVLVVVADVQRALLATSTAAREAGRVYVTGSSRADAERRARVAYAEVLANFGLRAGDRRAAMRLEAGCPPADGRAGCVGGFGPGAEVRVVVTYRVPVARLPLVGALGVPSVTVGATQRSRVDPFRGVAG